MIEDNVVRFPNPSKWASTVDAKLLDRLIAKGYLQHRECLGAPSRWQSTTLRGRVRSQTGIEPAEGHRADVEGFPPK
jgi:hypothetical protein